MINPSDFLVEEPSYQYVTYSYQKGFSIFFEILGIASIFALISMIISVIIGVRKKDCLSILVGNIMVKTIILFLYRTLNKSLNFNNFFIILLFFIVAIIIEGLIYKKVLQYKKLTGMTVSVICNIGTVVIMMILRFS